MANENPQQHNHANVCETAKLTILMHHAMHKIFELYQDFDERTLEQIKQEALLNSHEIYAILPDAEFGIRFMALFSILCSMALVFREKETKIQESYELLKNQARHEKN